MYTHPQNIDTSTGLDKESKLNNLFEPIMAAINLEPMGVKDISEVLEVDKNALTIVIRWLQQRGTVKSYRKYNYSMFYNAEREHEPNYLHLPRTKSPKPASQGASVKAQILGVLHKHEKGLTSRDIADLMGYKQGFMTTCLNQLFRLRLVDFSMWHDTETNKLVRMYYLTYHLGVDS